MEKKNEGILIDFVKIQELIPKDGTLTLTFKRSGDKLIVCYAPKYNVAGHEHEKRFQPVTLSATPEELNEVWGTGITDVSANEKTLAELLSEKSLSAAKGIEDYKKEKVDEAAKKVKAEEDRKKTRANAKAKAKPSAVPSPKKKEPELKAEGLFSEPIPEPEKPEGSASAETQGGE